MSERNPYPEAARPAESRAPIPATLRAVIDDVRRRRPLPSDDELGDFHAWVRAQPKVETHVHLEAACGAAVFTHGHRPPTWAQGAPWERAPFADLRAFIGAWVDLTRAVRELSLFEAMAEAFVAERHAENIVYTEAYCSPSDFSFIRERFRIAPEVFAFDEVLRAYVRGLRRGLARYPGIDVRLIVDGLWPSLPDEHRIVRDALTRAREDAAFFDADGRPYVIGVGLGGAETHHLLDERAAFLEELRGIGYALDIHSGEGTDAALHAGTLDRLRPDRVAHGFAGFDQNIVFTQNLVSCPVSNLLLGTFPGKPETHPIFAWLDQGVPVAIGSDDPLLLGHSLSWEYAFIHALRGHGETDFHTLTRDARRGALAPGVSGRGTG